MWRIGVFVTVAAVVLVACGGGDEEQVCQPHYTASDLATSNAGPVPTYTLSAAKESVSWLRLPSDLPDGASGTVLIAGRPGCPKDANWLTVGYAGTDYSLSIMEFKGTEASDARTTPIRINGTRGRFKAGNGYEGVSWKRGGIAFDATAKMGGVLTHERLLQVLESIPD